MIIGVNFSVQPRHSSKEHTHFIIALELAPFYLLPSYRRQNFKDGNKMQSIKYLQWVALKFPGFHAPPTGFILYKCDVCFPPSCRAMVPSQTLSLTLSGGGEQMLLRHLQCRPPSSRCHGARRCVAMVHPAVDCAYFRPPKTTHHLHLLPPPVRRRPVVRSECLSVGQGLRETAGCNPFRRSVCTVPGLWIICSKARPSGNINNGRGICLPG